MDIASKEEGQFVADLIKIVIKLSDFTIDIDVNAGDGGCIEVIRRLYDDFIDFTE